MVSWPIDTPHGYRPDALRRRLLKRHPRIRTSHLPDSPAGKPDLAHEAAGCPSQQRTLHSWTALSLQVRANRAALATSLVLLAVSVPCCSSPNGQPCCADSKAETFDGTAASEGDGQRHLPDAGPPDEALDARPADAQPGPDAQSYPPADTPYHHLERPQDLAFPEVGQWIQDPSTGTWLTRITDYDPELWEGYPKHDYAKRQPWNADATLYRFSSVAIYDSQTFQVVQELPNLYVAVWSNTDPNIIYGFRPELRRIERYSIDTATTQVVMDLANECDYLRLGPGEGNIDAFDLTALVTCRKETDLVLLLVDLQAGEVLVRKTYVGAWANAGNQPTYVDWASVSQLGGYVVVVWADITGPDDPFVDGGHEHYGVEVFDTATLEFERRLWHYGNHGDLCVDQNGDEVYVQFAGPDGTYLNMYRLRDGLHTSLIHDAQNPSDIPRDFSGHAGHVSCRNLDRPGWAYISLESNSDSPEFQCDGEVLAVKLDDSGTVEHFVHHFSSATTYGKSAMPVPSPDGRLVMFTSDWCQASLPEVHYEFIATWHRGP